ncbi:MAG: hypothetical protein EOP84_33555 [Verrucomicrobiaceae bacterium]|nr:MAG: hypothetical protein EOP84_33555 [Verrucomicrobiaceae bacterium]
MQRHDLNLFADYHQFYLQDELAVGDLSDAWTEEATDRLLATAPGVVGVGTIRDMEVPVTVEVLDHEPAQDSEHFDHVVECSLAVTSGRVVVAGCTDYFPEARRIDLPAGIYRLRVSYADLNSLSADAMDGNDSYRLQLWLAPPIEVSVLKRRAV